MCLTVLHKVKKYNFLLTQTQHYDYEILFYFLYAIFMLNGSNHFICSIFFHFRFFFFAFILCARAIHLEQPKLRLDLPSFSNLRNSILLLLLYGAQNVTKTLFLNNLLSCFYSIKFSFFFSFLNVNIFCVRFGWVWFM